MIYFPTSNNMSLAKSRIRHFLFFASLLSVLVGCAMEMNNTDNPSSVAISPINFNALFVVNGETGSLSVINAEANELAGTISFKNASFPHHIALNGDRSDLSLAIPGMDLSAGHESSGSHGMMMGSVLVLDAATGKTIVSRMLDGPNHNAAFSPDGKEIWTSQMTMPGKILVLDATTLKTKQSIDAGDMPAEVTFSKDGKYAFAANGMTNNVTVMDVASKAVVKTIPVGSNPVGAWQGNDGIMYVDNETGKSITAIDASSLEIVRTYNLGFMPGMAATAPSGELWVTDSENGKVAFYAAGANTKTGELPTGTGAHGIAFSSDGKTAYISNQAAGTLSIIDISSKTVAKTLTVGAKPNGMVFRMKP